MRMIHFQLIFLEINVYDSKQIYSIDSSGGKDKIILKLGLRFEEHKCRVNWFPCLNSEIRIYIY